MLAEIEYQGFRNLSDERVSFEKDFNLVIGENAAGKTNFLEAIFYAAFASSFRTSDERNLIRFNDNHLRVSASSNDKSASVFYDGEKRLTLDGNIKQRLGDYIGWLLVTVLSLEDIWLLRSAPVRRRAFLDWLIAKLTPSYLTSLTEYRKILKQRNRALLMVKENGDYRLLDVYDERLVTFGNELYQERKKNMPELSENVNRFGDELGLKHLALSYLSTCPDMNLTLCLLKNIRSGEIRWGETTIGPHRDDLVFYTGDHPLKGYGSEGEERSAVIALKLAEAEMIYDRTKKQPVLLLDEIAAELDSKKKETFFHLIMALNNREQRQVFYASTQDPDFIDTTRLKKFTVKGGLIEVS